MSFIKNSRCSNSRFFWNCLCNAWLCLSMTLQILNRSPDQNCKQQQPNSEKDCNVFYTRGLQLEDALCQWGSSQRQKDSWTCALGVWRSSVKEKCADLSRKLFAAGRLTCIENESVITIRLSKLVHKHINMQCYSSSCTYRLNKIWINYR